MARKNVENNETETKVKAVKYEIAWPSELVHIKPAFMVEVSATRMAHVYNDFRTHVPSNGGDPFIEHGYSIRFVLKRTGLPPQNDDFARHYYYRENGFYKSLLDVKLAIEDYSTACQPKVKTVTQKVKVEVGGDDEE